MLILIGSQIGRLNLLTPQRVAHAAKTEIVTGETVRLEYVVIVAPLSLDVIKSLY